MNPSASGWIKKHFKNFESEIRTQNYATEDFYERLKKTGFIYANSLSTLTYPEGTTFKLTLEEISKVNLLDSLGYTYFNLFPEKTPQDFIKSAIGFYEYLKTHSWFSFTLPFIKASAETKLEKIIDHRIQTNLSIFQKSFSSLVANALLYLDVLIYAHYLKDYTNPLQYAKSLEALIANTIYIGIQKKTDKDEQDQLVLKMLEVSIRYNKIPDISLDYKDLNYDKHKLRIECRYLLDLSCMTTYADTLLEASEETFIEDLGIKLGFTTTEIEKSIQDAQSFIQDNAERIHFLGENNPFKNLYDHTHETVKVLVLRNKKRLITEIRESQELVTLLQKSQTTALTKEEKAKVKAQLLDICKVIPSLGIFILPGGSILLPILTKFIPSLLPSAFSDNK